MTLKPGVVVLLTLIEFGLSNLFRQPDIKEETILSQILTSDWMKTYKLGFFPLSPSPTPSG